MDLPSRDIVLFESHDAVRDRYERRHNRKIKPAKVSEIVAFFSQGRQYFDAAATAGPLVSPLLAYYGVNAMTRGAILFLDPVARQATLRPSHGLSLVNWQNDLAAGVERLGELKIAVEASGTFSEYAATSQNHSWMMATTDRFEWKRIKIPGSGAISSDTVITVADVLSRTPDLNELYETVSGEQADLFSASLRLSGGSAEVIVFGSRNLGLDEGKLQALVPSFRDLAPLPDTTSGDDRPSVKFIMSADVQALPPLRYSVGATWLQIPLVNELNLSTVSVLYLFSYAIGMLARYFPREWLMLLAGSKGDRLFPAVREGLKIVSKRFPSELAGELSA